MSLLMRIIKKYPNRRLYDTSISAYVTLENIKRLVLAEEEFEVVDSRSHEDITRSMLLQILSEQEAHDGMPLFTNQVLQQLIRFYGDNLQGLMSEYLERSVAMFLEQQKNISKQVESAMDRNPFSVMSKIAEHHMELWHKLSESKDSDNN